MRIAIVNDQDLALEALRKVILTGSEHEICWVAHDGAEAVAQCARDVPDLVLMDLNMPVMDGVEATCRIMADNPCPILIVTSSIEVNAPMVFQAMGAGALDAIDTPILNGPDAGEGSDRLLGKIRMIGVLTAADRKQQASAPIAGEPGLASRKLVAIGASSGGPQALARVVGDLPGDIPAPVVIIQHVDRKFVQELAKWLSTQVSLPVYMAKTGQRPSNGNVYIACTNDHLVIDRKGCFAYTAEPRELPYRPSVDVFFNSLVENWRGNVLGVLLTGMGNDGAAGLLNLKNRGWYTLCQDKASSAVYGMPKAATELNAAREILSIKRMGEKIAHIISNGKSHGTD